MIYQHSTNARQREIADRIGKNARKALGTAQRSGMRMARTGRSVAESD